MLLSASAVSAQQYVWLLDENGALTGKKVADVSSLRFNIDSSWLTVTNTLEGKTTTSLTAKVGLSLTGEVKSIVADNLEVGVCYSDENTMPTIEDKRDVIGSEIKEYEYVLSDLMTGTSYYCRPYVKINDNIYYGDVMNAKTYGGTPENRVVNGHKFIDLGLPSGVLWSETNIGASARIGEGSFVAWGETSNKLDYSLDKYKYFEESAYTKYTTTDAAVRLEGSDDAASVAWGATCRLPLAAELEELFTATDYVTTSWTQLPDAASGEVVYGLYVTSKKYNTHIFLPASGCYSGGEKIGAGTYGKYWSSSRTVTQADGEAQAFTFSSESQTITSDARWQGLSIRPVIDK